MKRLSPGAKAASSRMNRWLDPSFSDLSKDSLSVSEVKKTRRLASKAEPKRPVRKRADPGSGLVQMNQDDPWVDRHTPQSQAELAVHKKKIEEVEKWITDHIATSKGSILLVTGPSGCGKTATIQVLSKELGVSVQEWTNPVSLEQSSMQQEWQLNSFSGCSQLQQFQDFLLRANKYSCLQMSGDRPATNRKLILVEEFPNQFYRQPSGLHDTLRRFVKTGRCPLVVIVSDSLSGDCSSRHLFPLELQGELGIGNICFNPVAPTTMMKVLNRILAIEAVKSRGRLCVPEQALLDRLCTGSSGDIRSAINSLQFSCIPDSSFEKSLLRTFKERSVSGQTSVGKARQKTKSKKKWKKVDEEEQAIGGKDASLFLFRALGKILHFKRSEGVKIVAESCLPPHLSEYNREALLLDPELVVERSHMSGDFFNLYLHQNYLDFFSELEDVDRASEYLSDADLLTADWANQSLMCDYCSSVATRGLIHANSQQVNVGFRPFHKPHWLTVNKKYRGNCLAAQSLFRSFCLTPVSLQTELLPYLAKLTNPMRNHAQIAFIQDVGQLSLTRRPERLKLETVADKELGQLPEDSEENEQTKAEEALPASQTQPDTNQALLQHEDLLIEEYDSD